MLGLFKNKCTSCEHYSEYRNPDKLTKNKNIIEGKVEVRYCSKMKDTLDDLVACQLFEWRTIKHSARSEAFLHYLTNIKN